MRAGGGAAGNLRGLRTGRAHPFAHALSEPRSGEFACAVRPYGERLARGSPQPLRRPAGVHTRTEPPNLSHLPIAISVHSRKWDKFGGSEKVRRGPVRRVTARRVLRAGHYATGPAGKVRSLRFSLGSCIRSRSRDTGKTALAEGMACRRRCVFATKTPCTPFLIVPLQRAFRPPLPRAGRCASRPARRAA